MIATKQRGIFPANHVRLRENDREYKKGEYRGPPTQVYVSMTKDIPYDGYATTIDHYAMYDT